MDIDDINVGSLVTFKSDRMDYMSSMEWGVYYPGRIEDHVYHNLSLRDSVVTVVSVDDQHELNVEIEPKWNPDDTVWVKAEMLEPLVKRADPPNIIADVDTTSVTQSNDDPTYGIFS